MRSLSNGVLAKSFDAAAVTVGNGTPFALLPQAQQVTWQTSFADDPSAISILIQISLDNINWNTVVETTVTAGDAGSFLTSAGFIRARIDSATGGDDVTVGFISKVGSIGTVTSDGATGLLSTIVVITTAELAQLHSVPKILVAAQGVGTLIVPIYCTLEYIFGTASYGGGSSFKWGYDGSTSDLEPWVAYNVGNAILSGEESKILTTGIFSSSQSGMLPENIVNKPLTFATSQDPSDAGSITEISVVDGGIGNHNAPGDSINIDPGSGGIAEGTIVTVTITIPIIGSAIAPDNTFTVAGDQTAHFDVDSQFRVYASGLNNAIYTVVSAVFGSGSTVITVVESVLSNAGDGSIIPSDSEVLTINLTSSSGYPVGSFEDRPGGNNQLGNSDAFTVDYTSESNGDGSMVLTLIYKVIPVE